MRYKLRTIGATSAAKVGLVIGMLLGVLPTLFNVLALAWVASQVQSVLHQWENVKIELSPIPAITLNLVEKLGLAGVLSFLDRFNNLSTHLLLFASGVCLTGLVWAGLGALAALAYNLVSVWTGGLDVTLKEVTTLPGSVSTSVPPTLVQQPATYAPRGASVVSAPAGLGPHLSQVSDPSQMWPINKPVYLIGSAAGSDLRAGGLALQHARIEFDQANRVYVLYDLSNGQTWVNERLVPGRNMLKNGFRIRLRQIELDFHL